VLLESSRETLSPNALMSLVPLGLGDGGVTARLPAAMERLARRAGALLMGPADDGLDADRAELLYGCSGCLACRDACDHGNDVPQAVFAARAGAWREGLAPAGVQAMHRRFGAEGAPARGAELAAAMSMLAAESPSVPDAPRLWAGCETPVEAPDSVRAALRISRRLAAPLSLAVGPLCCGRPLYEAGDREGFARHVATVWHQLREGDVVVLSPGCGEALSTLAREVGVEPRGSVTHLVVHLSACVPGHGGPPPLAGSVTYHDPCRLGRGQGVWSAPRRLLSLALLKGVQEPAETRELAGCCGGGGLLPLAHPEVARGMAMRRADMLRETGADRYVTACSGCRRTLSAAGLPVVDVVDIVAEWLESADRSRA